MASSAPATGSAPSAAGGPPGNAQGQFHSASLYVGDLNSDVSEGLLFEIFNTVGPVASIRVCRDAVTRRSLGYAYVNFHNVTDAERALDTMNYTLIKNRPCRIMWSQRDPSLRKSGIGNIFVKNLDGTIDNKALFDTFSLFGNILSCKVAMDESGGSKGYGYVHYDSAEAASEAISRINEMKIGEKVVTVGNFQRRETRPGQSDWTNIYVKNFPTSYADNDLEMLFAEYGSIDSAKVATDDDGKGRGFGFINFSEHDSAFAAVEALNESTKFSADDEHADITEPMMVTKAQKKSERERELRAKFEQMKSERINKYQGVNLYVKNLDDQMTDDQLRTTFEEFGVITSARIMREGGATGASRGFGFVCYSQPEEATKAVEELYGKMILGKPIFVALAQRKEVRRAQLEATHAATHAQRVVGMGQPGPRGMMPIAGPYGAMQPMMYPGQPMPRGPAGGYPMMMMPRGQPRGPMPGYPQQAQQQRGGYPMPAYMPAPQGQQQQGGRQGRGRRGPGGPGQPQQGRGPMPPRGMQQMAAPQQYAYGGKRMPGQAGPGGMLMPGAMPPQPPQPGAAPAQDALTLPQLASATPSQQKNMIGERLYPLIHNSQPELAGKITGMLLEMDNGELLHLLESPDALRAKITEALEVLKQHQAVADEN